MLVIISSLLEYQAAKVGILFKIAKLNLNYLFVRRDRML